MKRRLRASVKLGHNVVAEYFAQDQYKVLDGEARMLDDISRAGRQVPEVAAALAAGLLSLLRRRRVQAAGRAFRRRAQPLCAGADSGFAVELPAARRAHQPPGHARQRCAARSARGLQRHGGLCLARPLLHRPAGHARARSGGRRGHQLRRQLRRLSAPEGDASSAAAGSSVPDAAAKPVLYQGTASAVPKADSNRWGFSPCRFVASAITAPSSSKAATTDPTTPRQRSKPAA